MILLDENEFMGVYRHDDINAFEQRFKNASIDLFGEGYINQMRIFGKLIGSEIESGHAYPNIIINTTENGPTMEPEVQEWMHNTFYPLLVDYKITTKAYCLGEEILSKLSVELTAGDDPNSQFKFKFFSNLDDGIEWLRVQNLTI